MGPLTVFIITTLILIIVGVIVMYKSDDNYGKALIGGILIFISPLIAILITYHIYKDASTEQEIPQAIDVYRGKTTLQITYQDSIPVDSVVIFRK